MRIDHKVKVTKDKAMDLKEFAQSLELDHKMFNVLHRKSSSIHSYAYFFDVELERKTEGKSTLKWT